MSYRLEHGMIQLGGEAWPAGVRGEPEGLWVNRPNRYIGTARLLLAVTAVLSLSLGALYFIAYESNILGVATPLASV